MNTLKATFILCFCFPFMLFAQRQCGSELHWEHLLAQQPELAQARVATRTKAAEWLEQNPSSRLGGPITIPVVFHVVYSNAGRNLPNINLEEQIDVLNGAYNDTLGMTTPWGVADDDCGIRFCLAALDPLGNPTTGITRTQTGVNSFTVDDAVKSSQTGGADPWPSTDYLNIWVCKLQSGVLGYGQYPGGSAATDGIVLHYENVGISGASMPWDGGKVGVHEAAHWLDVPHLGCDTMDDGITDTWGGISYSCPSFPQLDTGCAPLSPGVMYGNFLQFGSDACLCFFTPGQCAFVNATMATSRASLLSSTAGCSYDGWASTNCSGGQTATDQEKNGYEVKAYPVPADQSAMIEISGPTPEQVDLVIADRLGRTVLKTSFSGTKYQLDTKSLAPGLYFFRLSSSGEIIGKGKLMVGK